MEQERRLARLTGIEEVGNRIEQWRKTRVKGKAMPSELWSAAVELSGRHGAYPVARALRLDYGALKKRANLSRQDAGHDGFESVEALSFVELPALQLLGKPERAAESVVELFGADGARVRIRLPGSVAVDVPGLATAFWRRGSCSR